ncbi:unnamed protein product [Cuscuta epithymum]|uniref:Uncharacterized protein n=1 Tax=Cuscuta epithymum TaxID=186058 RepID=A0AAV0CL09_9ASTE|nr:unnamed protein product [Cuscuta epithymum]
MEDLIPMIDALQIYGLENLGVINLNVIEGDTIVPTKDEIVIVGLNRSFHFGVGRNVSCVMGGHVALMVAHQKAKIMREASLGVSDIKGSMVCPRRDPRHYFRSASSGLNRTLNILEGTDFPSDIVYGLRVIRGDIFI